MKPFFWACVNFLPLLSVQVLDIDSNKEGSMGQWALVVIFRREEPIFNSLPLKWCLKLENTEVTTVCNSTEKLRETSDRATLTWVKCGKVPIPLGPSWTKHLPSLQLFSKWPLKSVSDDAFCDTFVKNELGLMSINCILSFAMFYRHMLMCNFNEN